MQEREREEIYYNSFDLGVRVCIICVANWNVVILLNWENDSEIGLLFHNSLCQVFVAFLQQQRRRYLGVPMEHIRLIIIISFTFFNFKIFERYELMTSLYTVNYLYGCAVYIDESWSQGSISAFRWCNSIYRIIMVLIWFEAVLFAWISFDVCVCSYNEYR